jgi:hypothetical protein
MIVRRPFPRASRPKWWLVTRYGPASVGIHTDDFDAMMTPENQIRGLALVFGIRLPRELTAAFIDPALKAGEGVAGFSAAVLGRAANRSDDGGRRHRRGHETYGQDFGGLQPADDTPGVAELTALAFASPVAMRMTLTALAMTSVGRLLAFKAAGR